MHSAWNIKAGWFGFIWNVFLTLMLGSLALSIVTNIGQHQLATEQMAKLEDARRGRGSSGPGFRGVHLLAGKRDGSEDNDDDEIQIESF